jgi:hypothetical protein
MPSGESAVLLISNTCRVMSVRIYSFHFYQNSIMPPARPTTGSQSVKFFLMGTVDFRLFIHKAFFFAVLIRDKYTLYIGIDLRQNCQKSRDFS